MDIMSLFFKIKSWSDFNDGLVHLNKKQKGDAFELLTKFYFEIDHKYNNYDNIWLLSEVPKKDLEIIGLESMFYKSIKTKTRDNLTTISRCVLKAGLEPARILLSIGF